MSWQEPITPGSGNGDCQSKTIFQFNKGEKNTLKFQQEILFLKSNHHQVICDVTAGAWGKKF